MQGRTRTRCDHAVWIRKVLILLPSLDLSGPLGNVRGIERLGEGL